MSSPRKKVLASLALTALTAGALSLTGGSAGAAHDRDSGGKGRSNDSAVEEGKTYNRFIVHFTSASAASADDSSAQQELDEVGKNAGHKLGLTRRLSTDGVLLSVDEDLDAAKARKLMAKFLERTSVDYIEPDVIMTATLTPNDSSYLNQWHYYESLAGMNLPTAWDTADGTGVTVAVIDTGITTHSDLSPNVVAGYDFISNATTARDGNGRDSNPADQGDWYGLGDCVGAISSNSSWHGTHVAGTIAAVTNNAKGVSGAAFNAKIQPVRVLGKCGGTLADIADAVVWASGGTVAGIPANATPSKVINMSLGGSGACGATYQNAINGAVARGTTVVVAAGNSNADASGYQPSGCANVISVAASDREGNRASYSNYGSVVDITAPGGETNVNVNGVLSTLNSGTTTPAAESYAYYQGTSMASPHVAGLAALILGEVAKTPAQVESIIKAGARPMPGACSGGCGAGLADATKTIASLGVAASPSASPTAASPSPTAASPSPTAASPSPTSASPSPTAASPSPTAASPSPTTPTQPSSFENPTNINTRDLMTVESPITVSGRTGNAPVALQVSVDIKHTFRGDLQIDLAAPDGTLYRLKSTSSSDSADNVITTYTVNASSEVANGTWKLRVYDNFLGDGGYIDRWALQF
ncbi:MAG TPA: S8 family serine peptidase [Mycobacteriales bacterium]|nr:S8 family serine peptidase [Mycobacteriales bacterium]